MRAEDLRNFGGEIGLNPQVTAILCGMPAKDLKDFQEGRMTDDRREMYSEILLKRLHRCAVFFLKQTRGNDIELHEDGGIFIKVLIKPTDKG